ncbi:uncharacterized protein JCM15063_004090 [Sporobolomyces koalae]|uniref:uncharacterized protein n=1 Tax=Sporobolomyces koalae TaxID=500713 RepID=UPI003175CC86
MPAKGKSPHLPHSSAHYDSVVFDADRGTDSSWALSGTSPKAATVKLPPAQDPAWRAYYREQNDKLKAEHPGWTGSHRRRFIQSEWRKAHAPQINRAKAHDAKKEIKRHPYDESESEHDEMNQR